MFVSVDEVLKNRTHILFKLRYVCGYNSWIDFDVWIGIDIIVCELMWHKACNVRKVAAKRTSYFESIVDGSDLALWDGLKQKDVVFAFVSNHQIIWHWPHGVNAGKSQHYIRNNIANWSNSFEMLVSSNRGFNS